MPHLRRSIIAPKAGRRPQPPSAKPPQEKPTPTCHAIAEAGEEVIIARNGKPAVKLVLVVEPPPPARLPNRVLGRLAGKFHLPDDWENQWNGVGKEVANPMINGPTSNH